MTIKGPLGSSGGYLFALPSLAKDITGRRYMHANQVVKEIP